jgi:hypothetical protein
MVILHFFHVAPETGRLVLDQSAYKAWRGFEIAIGEAKLRLCPCPPPAQKGWGNFE